MNELKRDSVTNRIVSYLDQRASQNTGRIEVPVIDERFLTSDFNFVVKTKFSSLKEAVDAESAVQSKLNTIQTTLLKGIPISSLSPTDIQNVQSVAKNQLLENLTNIQNSNPNSIPGLQRKIEELQNVIDQQRDDLAGWKNAANTWDDRIRIWANEYQDATIRADAFERMNVELSKQQEQILTDLKTDIDIRQSLTTQYMSDLSDRTNLTLSEMNKEIKAIRDSTPKFGDLSKVIDISYNGSAGTGGTSGTGGTGG